MYFSGNSLPPPPPPPPAIYLQFDAEACNIALQHWITTLNNTWFSLVWWMERGMMNSFFKLYVIIYLNLFVNIYMVNYLCKSHMNQQYVNLCVFSAQTPWFMLLSVKYVCERGFGNLIMCYKYLYTEKTYTLSFNQPS